MSLMPQDPPGQGLLGDEDPGHNGGLTRANRDPQVRREALSPTTLLILGAVFIGLCAFVAIRLPVTAMFRLLVGAGIGALLLVMRRA